MLDIIGRKRSLLRMCCDMYVGGGGGGGDLFYFIILKMASVFKLPDVNVYVCVWGRREGGRRNNVFTLLKRIYIYKFSHYTYHLILLPFSSTVSLSVFVFTCDWN